MNLDIDGLPIVAPLWSKFLSQPARDGLINAVGFIDGQILDIGKYNYCVVGEFHGFRDGIDGKQAVEEGTAYDGCSQCVDFALEFDNGIMSNKRDWLQSTIRRFVSHCKESHWEKLR